VISVGNLVVGGSGKTPAVAAIARLLLTIGERPAILSRGYARRKGSDGVVVVSDGTSVLVDVGASGDEPQMLARGLPGVAMLVAADRYLAGRLAEQRFGATVMVLDDAFQHLQLDRTVDLLVVSPEDLGEQVLPFGRLREPLTAARRADAVLVYGGRDEAQHIAGTLGVPTSFTVTSQHGAIRSIAGPPATPSDRRVVAFAGIARPRRFFAALRDRGYDVADELTFRDHHWFSRADVARIAAAARAAHANLVVTTEKDAVRLEGMLGVPELAGGADVRWGVLPMEATIEPAASFATWLQSRLRTDAVEERRA
jgi:tetraacyldisaccharide 4'-kinase